MKKPIDKTKIDDKSGIAMALWGSSVRSRSRPPLLKLPKDQNIVEIPAEWEVLPAARMTENGPDVCRVLIRKIPKKFEKNLNGKRRKKSA